MHEKPRNIGKYARPAAEIAAAGLASAFVTAAGITARNHRELTHRSIILHPWLQQLADFDQRTIGVGDTTIWADVHRTHHGIPDATLFPFWHIARAVRWMNQNPGKVDGVTFPDTFPHLDPYVDRFSREDVFEIGMQADTIMRQRLGDAYKEPTGYTPDELNSLFHPTEPTYYYPKDKHVGPYSQDDIAELLLGDPHSPVRIRPPELNGVRGVLKQNYPLYTRAAELFRKRPELKSADLQSEGDGNKEVTLAHRIAGVLIPAGVVLLRRGKFKPKDFAIALAAGAAIFELKTGYVVAGGNIVNSLGHAGELNRQTLKAALQNKVFQPRLKADGTVATDTTATGILGRALSAATFDEVGGQAEHHKSPEKIAYTSQKGWRAWRDAPWGMTLETLADSKWFPLLKGGAGFNLKEGEPRPDQPIRAMEIIHRRRAEQLAKKNLV